MLIYINAYTSHLNQFLYSLIEYQKEFKIKIKIIYNNAVKGNCVLIEHNGKTFFLDYSDDSKFSDDPSLYTYYYKRSLRIIDFKLNIRPLNFQVNFATNPLVLLQYLPKNKEFLVKSYVELIRLIDFFKYTNMSHYAMLYNSFLSNQVNKGKGGIIFYTRLWDPDNNKNQDEKERRKLQNEFRIASCRIIKNNFSKSEVGIFDSKLAREICPDLIFQSKIISKKEYLSQLSKASICIADDGLKDTPGWKIGEYALMGKSIITTPINVVINDFSTPQNCLQLSSRNSYDEIPEKIDSLLFKDNYLQMADNNIEWSSNYLKPSIYISRIIEM